MFPGSEVPNPPEKFWHEVDDKRHPGKLRWPGANGLPFLGAGAHYLTPREQQALRVVAYTYVKTFDLDDPEDLEYYTWIKDHVNHKLFYVDEVQYRPTEYAGEDGVPRVKMYVYMEWRQFYAYQPSAGRSRSNGDSNFVMR